MNRRIIYSVVIFVLLMPAVKAQEIHRLTLSSAVEMARTQNTNVRNAGYDMEIARHQVWEYTAMGLPQVTSQVSYRNNIDLPVTLMPARIFDPTAGPDDYIEMKFGVQHNAQFNFQVNQLVFNSKYLIGVQTAKTFKFLKEQSKNKTENDVITTVTQTYNTILFSLKNKWILENTLKDIDKTYNEIKKTFEAGLAEETAVDQIQLNKLTVENAIKAMDRQISVQYDLLKIQTGIDINDSIVIVDSLEGVFENAGIEKSLIQPFDKEKNIDYQLMKTREEISKQQITLEKSALIPSVNAFYTHTQSGQSDEFSFFEKSQKWFPSNVIGAALVIPITTSGGTISKIKQKELELRKVQNNKALLEQNLQLQVNTARNKLAKAYDTYLTQKKNVVLAERIYKRSLVKFTQGVITSTELTQVNTQYFNSQSAYFAAMLEVLNAKAELDKILGNNL